MQLDVSMETARELMTPDPFTLEATATVADALALLRELDVRHLPLINDDREVVGMLSDRDLRGLALVEPTEEWPRGRLDILVSEVMSTDVLAVELDTPADEIIELMLEYKIGAVPVVNVERHLIGIVSYIDVLRHFRPLLSSEEKDEQKDEQKEA